MSQVGYTPGKRPASRRDPRRADLWVGLAAPLVAALIPLLLPSPAREVLAPWPFLLTALSVAGWGGLGPGLLATSLGVGLYLGVVGSGSGPGHSNFALLNGVLLGASGCLVSWLGEQYHRMRREAGEVAKQALQHQRELECEVGERNRAEAALRASEESLRMALEASRTVAWNWDLKSGELEHSQSSRLVLGSTPRSAEELVALIHPDDRQRVEDALIRVLDGRGAYEEVFRIVRPDGEVRWVADEGNLVYGVDGEPERLVGCLRDVTEQHRILEALAEADRRKNEFLAMLAHELRNPLAPIRTAVRLLQVRLPQEETAHRHLELIDRQVGNMARLLEDLLDVSRITRGTVKLKTERVDLCQVLGEALEVCQALLRQRRHDLQVSLPEAPLWLLADRLRLEQVIVNLVNNAAKYTDPGGSISVEVVVRDQGPAIGSAGLGAARTGSGPNESVVSRAAAETDAVPRTAELRVRDTGRGIAPELLPRVFDLFVQGEPGLDRSQGGLGIGLTMVRRLVEMHGGTVAVESAGLGLGSVFTVSLPLADTVSPGADEGVSRSPCELVAAKPQSSSHATGSPPAAADSLAPHSHRILVVDDNRDGAEALLELLEMWGYEGQAVFDGPAALRAAETFQPSVVICDLGMPGMDGFAVGRRLRDRQAAVPSVPPRAETARADGGRNPNGSLPSVSPVLIAITGYGREEDRRRSEEAGFRYHLTKPIDPEQLSGLLAAVTAGEGIGSC